MADRSGEGAARDSVGSPTAVADDAVTTSHDGAHTVGGTPLADLVSIAEGMTGPRSKRALILAEAAKRFGETGYEATKWSVVAAEVGIGQTALYHYFESKAHCLLTIMRIELARSHERFLGVVAAGGPPEEVLRQALETTFAVSPTEVLQLRIVMANGDVLAKQRASAREEAERQHCLALMHAIESSWTELVGQARPTADTEPHLVAQAVLGLINSVWRWYRPEGRLPLAEIAHFYVTAAERVVQAAADRAGVPARRRSARKGA